MPIFIISGQWLLTVTLETHTSQQSQHYTSQAQLNMNTTFITSFSGLRTITVSYQCRQGFTHSSSTSMSNPDMSSYCNRRRNPA
jgi:hypothetical protein